MASTTKRLTWKDFGPWLGVLRRRRGHSQQRLAEMLGCDRVTVWRIETGKTRPSRLFLHNLLQTYPLTPDETEHLTAFAQLHGLQCDEDKGGAERHE